MSNDLSALEAARRDLAARTTAENNARVAGGYTGGGAAGMLTGGAGGFALGKILQNGLLAGAAALPWAGRMGRGLSRVRRAATGAGISPRHLPTAGAVGGGVLAGGVGQSAGGLLARMDNRNLPSFMNNPVTEETAGDVSQFLSSNKQASDVAAVLTEAYMTKHADGQIDVQALLRRLGEIVANNPAAAGAVAGGTMGLASGTSITDRLRRAAGGAAIGGAMGYGGRMAYDRFSAPAGTATPRGIHAYPGGVINPNKMTEVAKSQDFKDYKDDGGTGLIQKGIQGGVGLAAGGVDQTLRAMPMTTTGAVLGAAHAGLTPRVHEAALGDVNNVTEGAKVLSKSLDKEEARAGKAVTDHMRRPEKVALTEKLRQLASKPTDTFTGRGQTAIQQIKDRFAAKKPNSVSPVTAGLDPYNPQPIKITGKDGKTHTGSVSSTVSDKSVWDKMVDEGAKANRAGAPAAPAVPGVKAPKVKAAKPVYRNLFTGNVGRGGQLGRFALPAAAGFAWDAGKYLLAPGSSPKQQSALSNMKKTLGS